jgi:anti-sigma-K factor RskA
MALERRTYTGPLQQLSAQAGGRQAATSRQVAAVSIEALGASPGGAAAGADLGGSSKYSNENFED